MRRPGRGVALALAVLFAAASAGCQAAPGPLPPPASDDPPAMAPPWRACSFGECTQVTVPVDHTDPDGPTLELAAARIAASAPRRGTLFVNPGGPGASGRELLGWFPRAGLEAYDIVAWDPRGVGASSGITCLDGPDADAHLALDASPDDAAERAELLASSRAVVQACRADAGVLLDHLSAEDNARDLEMLRARLAPGSLRYVGFSYGTVMGAAYADLFGDRVGRMVLDGGVDVNGPRVPQVVGFERALRALGPEVTASVDGLLADLEDEPLPVGERLLTQSLATSGVASFLYAGEAGPPRLVDAVRAARAGDGSGLLEASDTLTGRRGDGTYSGMFSSFRAIHCADTPRVTADEADAAWDRARAEAPIMGEGFGPDYTCIDWPATPREAGVVVGAQVGVPILVLGTTGDPATPIEWSRALADDLATGVLLVREGAGHTSFGRGSACVDEQVVDYLTRDDPGFTSAPPGC